MLTLILCVTVLASMGLGAAYANRVSNRVLQAERAKWRKERDEEQAALVGTIASGLAHEIRNPLSSLSLNLQLLREDWENPVTERERNNLKKIDTILREVGRLEGVLNTFLR